MADDVSAFLKRHGISRGQYVKAQVRWWFQVWGSPARWLKFRVSRGYASWCGKFLIVYPPVNWSLIAGRGTQGLWLYRWIEKGNPNG